MTMRKILRHGHGDTVKRTDRRPGRIRLVLAVPALAAAAAAASVSSAAAAPTAASASSVHTVAVVSMPKTTSIKTAKVGGVTVLTNAKGFTLYSFAPDSATMSKCNGACAQTWPPVKGPATASGFKAKFGTIKRANGSVQATYKGHPLYTFVGDTAPKQANGNGLNVNGGVWHEVTAAGTAKHSGGSAPGSGGSGY